LGHGSYLERLRRPSGNADRRAALASAWRALCISRLLVWAAATAGVFGIGTHAFREIQPRAEDPADTLSGVLLSPARRWDSGWYLSIAEHGYDLPAPDSTAFFPLYPLLIRVVRTPIGSFELAGVIVSCAAFIVALYLLHRLVDLEVGREAAERTVWLLALFPMAFYFSAIYTESLFLALTVGCFYSARRGWWGRAAMLGALASATRTTGVLLVVPLLAILLWGPREDRSARPKTSRWAVRYRPRARDAAVLACVPLGLLAYLAYVGAATRYGVLAPIKAQDAWMREFRGPIIGVWGGAKNAAWAAREVLSGARLNDPRPLAVDDLVNFAALAFASIGVVGAFRRLPVAYGAYALAGLVFAISFPPNDLRPVSLPRYIVVLFPIFIWFGMVTARRSYRVVALATSAAGLAVFSALFAAGYWIA
jgi:hypothetical protein